MYFLVYYLDQQNTQHIHIHVYVYMYMYMCVCVCIYIYIKNILYYPKQRNNEHTFHTQLVNLA